MPFVDTGEVTLAYDTSGPDDAPVLLLIRGLGGLRVSWPPPLLDPLIAAGVRVVTFDNRDAGESTWLAHLGAPDIDGLKATLRAGETPAFPYDLRDMAGDAFALLDHLRVRTAHVLGVSLGGMIAQRMAIDEPTRVASLTSVMSSTGDPTLSRPTKEATAALLDPDAPGLDGLLAGRARRRAAYGSGGFAHDEDWDRRDAEQVLAVGLNPDGNQRQYAATLADGDRTEQLRRLRLPALVVHGAQDRLIRPAAGQATAAAIPGARLQLVAGMGHDLPPQVCAMVAGWVLELVRR